MPYTESALAHTTFRHTGMPGGTHTMQGMGRYSRGRAGEQGAILVTALLLLGGLAVLGAWGVMLMSVDTSTTGNCKLATQSFYAAEAGTEEGRARLRANAGANRIADATPTSTLWKTYIGSTARAQAIGYDSTQSTQSLTDRLQAGLDYVVQIRHKTNAAGTQVLYWGDDNSNGVPTQNPTTGTNVYVVTSYGSTSTANRVLEVEVAGVPPITIPAALYVQAQTTVQGTSTFVDGLDACGGTSLPGVGTTLPNAPVGSPPRNSVEQNGSPNILGEPSAIVYNTPVLSIQAMVDALKAGATIKPNPQSGTLTGGNWGTPTGGTLGSATGQTVTLPTPSSCDTTNIVHFKTGGTQIKLAGGTSGCGILLVEGDLNLDGGFNWYGPIIATGSVTYAGGGNKEVTGAILSGGTVSVDLVGGNANLVYCSTAITNQTQNLPLQSLSWKEL